MKKAMILCVVAAAMLSFGCGRNAQFGVVDMNKVQTESQVFKDATKDLQTKGKAMEEELLIHEPMAEVVMHYAENAKKAGLDGVVCSPLEAGVVHERCGADFLTVTPGIRLAGDAKGDQKRVMTPADAAKIGSDYIVVGRSIT